MHVVWWRARCSCYSTYVLRGYEFMPLSVHMQDEHVSIAALVDAPLAWPCPAWLRFGGPAVLEGSAEAAEAPASHASSLEETSSSASSGSSGGAACNGHAGHAGGCGQQISHVGEPSSSSCSSSSDSASGAPGVPGSGSTGDSSDSARSGAPTASAAGPEPCSGASDAHEELDALLSAGGPRARAQALLLLERRRQEVVSRATTLALQRSARVRSVPARAAIASGASGAPPANLRHTDPQSLHPARRGCGAGRGGALGAAGRPACCEGFGLGNGSAPGRAGRRAAAQGNERRAARRSPVYVRRGAALEPVEALGEGREPLQGNTGAPAYAVMCCWCCSHSCNRERRTRSRPVLMMDAGTAFIQAQSPKHSSITWPCCFA